MNVRMNKMDLRHFYFHVAISGKKTKELSLQHKNRNTQKVMKSVQHQISPLLLFFFILEFENLFLSVASILCFSSFLLFILFILLFFSTLLSVPCSILSLSIDSLYFLISLSFFFLNLPPYLFSFPITLLCLLLPSVLLLYSIYFFSVILHHFRAFYLILLSYLFCS